jgi:hypothetical protein
MKILSNPQLRIGRILLLATIPILPAAAANLHGTVTYMGQRQLPEALVSVYAPAGSKAITVSNSDGTYSLTVPVGIYIITVEIGGRLVYQGRISISEPDTRFDIRI